MSRDATDQIKRTVKWNLIRGNTPDTLNMKLEFSMLKEELNEAVNHTDEANLFKELLDLQFVLLGTLGKMNLSAEQITEGYEAVLCSNETKSSTKNAEGKITKPADFVNPEPQLQVILDERN